MGKKGHINQQPQSLCRSTKQTLVRLSTLGITVALSAAATGMTHEPRAVAADLPIVKSAVLTTNLNVPWSRPVKVTDPFEGNYLAVFDKHYFYRRVLNDRTTTYVVSLWSPKSVRFLLTDSDYGCYSRYDFYTGFSGPNCVNNSSTEVIEIFLRVGEQVFRIEGENSFFKVSDELAIALEKSPVGNLDIRLVTRSGETIDSKIGKGTVEAWKAIY